MTTQRIDIQAKFGFKKKLLIGLVKDVYIITDEIIVGREKKKGVKPGMLCIETFDQSVVEEATEMPNFVLTYSKSGGRFYYFTPLEG